MKLLSRKEPSLSVRGTNDASLLLLLSRAVKFPERKHGQCPSLLFPTWCTVQRKRKSRMLIELTPPSRYLLVTQKQKKTWPPLSNQQAAPYFFRVHYLGHKEMGSFFPFFSLLGRKHERPILLLPVCSDVNQGKSSGFARNKSLIHFGAKCIFLFNVLCAH